MKGIVLHADGGVRPNPGPAGYGVHGYHYDTTINAKPIGLGSIVTSTQGYVEKDKAKEGTTNGNVVELTSDDILHQKLCVTVSPTKYVDMFGTVSTMVEGRPVINLAATNNRAEVRAAEAALHYIAQEKPDIAAVYTDSEYTVRGINEWLPNWIKRDFIRPDGTSIANADAWQDLQKALNKVNELNIPVRFSWIKGHNGHVGNERADKLATMGVFTSMRGKDYHTIENRPPEGFWKYATEKHPFLSHAYCYFNTSAGSCIPGEYYLGNHGKDLNLLGNRISDGTYSVVKIKQPDPVLEMVRNYQSTITYSADMLYVAHLTKIFTPDIHQDLNTYGELIIEPSIGQSTDLKTTEGVILTEEINPARLSTRAVDALTLLSDVLDQFLSSSVELCITDITSSIYEKTTKAPKATKKPKKGEAVPEEQVTAVVPEELVTKLRSEMVVGCPSIKVKGQYKTDLSEGSVDITLSTGIDILDRNSLKRLEELSPQVYLVTWAEGSNVFRYATVIKANEDVGIWAGIYSNLRVIAN